MKKLIIAPDHYLEIATPDLAKPLFDLVDENRELLEEWLNWVPKTNSSKDTLSFLEKNIARYEKQKSGAYAIYYKRQLAGLVDLHEISLANNKSNIGYWLALEFQKKGLMTKSVIAILDYAFNTLNLYRVAIEAAVDNARSRLIPERLGFKFEGVERAGNKIGDKYLDMAVYSLLKPEFTNS